MEGKQETKQKLKKKYENGMLKMYMEPKNK